MKLVLISNTGRHIVLAEAMEHFDLLHSMTRKTMWERCDREIQGLIDNDPLEVPVRGFDPEARSPRPVNRSNRSKGGRGKKKV